MRCQRGCALGVQNSARGALVLDSEPKDKQKVARKVARDKEMRSALLIVLSAVAVLLSGWLRGGVVVKTMKKFHSMFYSKSPLQ